MLSFTTNSFCLIEETNFHIEESSDEFRDEFSDVTRINVSILRDFVKGKIYKKTAYNAVIGLIDFQDELSPKDFAILIVSARKLGITL